MSTKIQKGAKGASSRMELVKAEGNTASLAASSVFMEGIDANQLIVKSRSPMIKPGDMPLGKAATGVLKRLISCTVQEEDTKKKLPKKYGCLIELVPVGRQVGAAIPATAVIANALEIVDADSENPKSPFIGHLVAIQRLPDKLPSKRGNDAWNFIIAVSPEPVKISGNE